ncbi:hypothetical protein [Planosporangium mesophilum]|uniref:DUF4034 domain-containing protein n=1 Tax=Planosporangium mesophilum TaxID=689768 RepID=A0A8J3TBU3_9ACTN|nr:hypothetical protein [Planosporangium mesophilum]GII23813.1 hypothetical protein Pme01_34100 [Planosporangium mesophilum]
MPPPLPPPNFDPAAASPELARLRNAVAARDWPTISTVFARVDQVTDATLYNSAVWIVAEQTGMEPFLEDLAARETPSTLARTLLACRLIEIGWGIRSNARAPHVSREQFAEFHEYLRRAERILIDVTALQPENLAAWSLRLTTARGLELGQAEARRRYDRAAAHDPNNLPAQRQLLQQLCPKWSGSWEEMHAFANGCMLNAPEGALNAVLVAEGHLERWLDLGRAEGAKYLNQPQVQQELVAAATRSVLHPSFQPRYGWVLAHSTFAMVFSLAGRHQHAAVHFRALGNLASESPWTYLGDPAQAFQRHRAEALAKGAAA